MANESGDEERDLELARNIRAEREKQGISLRSFALAVGVDAAAWSRTETGGRMLKASELVDAAAALGVPIDALVSGADVNLAAATRVAEASAEPVGAAINAWASALERVHRLWLDEAPERRDMPVEWRATALTAFLPAPRSLATGPDMVEMVRTLIREYLPQQFTASGATGDGNI
jgi:transcriptional regulator with XRE-family HTH domain